jgi:hypothetical protein
MAFLEDVARIIGSWGFARFAECVNKSILTKRTKQSVDEQAFEKSIKTEQFLKAINLLGNSMGWFAITMFW